MKLKVKDMFNGITWDEFITGLGLLAILYYIIVTIVYYRTDIKNNIKRRMKST
ncbi:hypothetical protein [Solitalea lacus]|uniref:hypothetical protein n=1 Tax=Solitalea lacus TaxID=2911172 RepID=UPI001EDBABF9|nr:hypothetical protein [Solitalea lacus]UKJ09220.1 hypothetical protein L2B55_08695 [Solitalea lacus]